MPRKVGEIIKMIEADGWFIVRTRGSHRHYRHPTKPGTTTVAGNRVTRCRLAPRRAS